MKNIIILVVSILLSASTIRATEVPAAVKTAFAQKFPTAKKVNWQKEKTNDLEASFMLDSKEVSATYSPDGKLKEVETEIPVSELPKAVTEALNKKYPGAKVNEAAKIVRADNTVVYEAEMKVSGKKTDLLFDENGITIN
jgi:hypothetical protein